MSDTTLHTKIFTQIVKAQFDRYRPKTLAEIEPIWPPRGLAVEHVAALDLDVGVDDYEEAGLNRAGRELVRALHRLRRSDPPARYDSVEAAQQELHAVFGNRLQTNADLWRDPTSDAGLVLLCTQGLAAHCLMRGDEPRTFVVDLSFMSDYPVRPGFVRYGARLVLDQDAHDALVPRAITWARGTHHPGDAQWEIAKLAFRVSIATAVTVRDHAIKCHFLASNAVVIATRTKLAGTHPIRELLRPFQFRTPAINSGALVTLIPEGAIFQRLFAFEWTGLCALYAHAKADFRWEDVPTDLARRGVAELPGYAYAEDALALWELQRQLTEQYLDAIDFVPDAPTRAFQQEVCRLLPSTAGVPELTTRAAVAEFLACSIYYSTAFHEQVGGAIGDYLGRLDFVVPTLVDGATFADMLPSKNTMNQGYMLGILTNLRMPKITADFSPLVSHKAGPVVHQWMSNLHQLGHQIDQRNHTRPQPLYTFHPKRLDLSVSI